MAESPKKATKSAARKTRKPAAKRSAPAILRSKDPASGRLLREVEATPPEEVANLVANARKVAPEWASLPPRGRAHILRDVRYRIVERMDDIVDVVSEENGKPRTEALAHDVLPTLLMLAYLERATHKALRPMRLGGVAAPLMGGTSRVEWRPFGVVGAIGPWNYPFFNTMLAFASALFAGNTVVVKPSEVTPGVGELLRDVLDVLPPGVTTVVQGGAEVGAALIDAPCDKISFIGSPATGRRICEAAAKHLTPVVMELGGKDAAIVCADADLDTASSGVVWGSFMNTGQTCCAVERIFVHEAVAEDFVERIADKVARLRQSGDGEIGPITLERQLDIVKRHVDDALAKGAHVIAGGPDAGRANKGGSRWYAPTVLEDVNDDMAVVTEETFGPVVTVTRVRDDDEALARANSGFNLTASVWSKDRGRGDAIAHRLRAGTVTINSHGDTLAMPWAPWGGVSESGFGRLNGVLGLREFSVPVHISRNFVRKMKKLWWYPYDEATAATLRGFAQVVGHPKVTEKLRGAKAALGSLRSTIKNKL